MVAMGTAVEATGMNQTTPRDVRKEAEEGILGIPSLGAVVLNDRRFCSPGDRRQCLEAFLFVTIMGGPEVRDAIKLSTMHMTAPRN